MSLPTKLPIERQLTMPTRITEVRRASAIIEIDCEGELLKGSIDFGDTKPQIEIEPVNRLITVQQHHHFSSDEPTICISYVMIDGTNRYAYPA